jgi:hypothetical protein
MKKWRILIPILSLTICIIIGSTLGLYFKSKVTSIVTTVEEELWNVDLIVKGTVVSQDETYKKDAGIEGKSKRDFSFDVTPATVHVDKVLYGNIDTNSITYLQHGASSDEAVSQKFLKKGEEVVLILVKTSDGTYWSYNFDDGVWKIKDGKVNSTTESQGLSKFKNYKVDKFMSEISEIAKNKRKHNE